MPNPSIITITDLGFAYPSGSSAIFELLSATLDRGWNAILGDNSCGKTTLALLLCQYLSPTQGRISPKLSILICEYCSQSIAEQPRNLDSFTNDWSRRPVAIRLTLGIADGWTYRYPTLSGGEGKASTTRLFPQPRTWPADSRWTDRSSWPTFLVSPGRGAGTLPGSPSGRLPRWRPPGRCKYDSLGGRKITGHLTAWYWCAG